MESLQVKHRLLELIQKKELELNRRVTVTEVAKGSGVSTRLITRWLENSPKLYDSDAISGFCRYFNCEISDLLYLERVEQ